MRKLIISLAASISAAGSGATIVIEASTYDRPVGGCGRPVELFRRRGAA